MSEQEQILKELQSIKRILTLSFEDKLEHAIHSFASTDLRKKLWVLSTGEYSYANMAEFLKTTPRNVQYFISEGTEKGLLELPKRGFPKRAIDFIPNWGIKLDDLVGKNETAPQESQESPGGKV